MCCAPPYLEPLTLEPRQKTKHVCEYLSSSPRCGTVVLLSTAEAAPLLRMAGASVAGLPSPCLPSLRLSQPSKVLAKEVRWGWRT